MSQAATGAAVTAGGAGAAVGVGYMLRRTLKVFGRSDEDQDQDAEMFDMSEGEGGDGAGGEGEGNQTDLNTRQIQ
jgi:hypothetical protein